MADDIHVIDWVCGTGARAVPRGSSVPEIAQLYALGLYRAWFRSVYPAGEVFTEWDLVGKVSVGMGRTAIDMALKIIKSDFRNYYSKSQRNRMRIREGTPASGLIEGRSVRADGLGIALDPIHRAIVAELIEVTTVDEAEATIIEDIQPKLALLRGPIKKLLERELAEARTGVSSMLPEFFNASGSPWVIPLPLAIVPIFNDVTREVTVPQRFRWICFGPTYRYRPILGGFAAPEPETAPARGLILYSYHEASQPQGVPQEVLRRFRDWAKQQQRRYQRLELLPTPEMSRYWQDNNDDLKQLLGYVALATTAVAVVVLAIYLAPLVAGAATAALTQLGAGAALDFIAVNAAALVAMISANVPQIMNFARSAVQSATSFGPRFGYAFAQ